MKRSGDQDQQPARVRENDHCQFKNDRFERKGILYKDNIIQISILSNRVWIQTKHFTMESLILAQDER